MASCLHIRQPVQDFLTLVWLTKVPFLQQSAPYEAVEDALNEVIKVLDPTDGKSVSDDDDDESKDGKHVLRIVDCCSGAGGPMPAIERNLK